MNETNVNGPDPDELLLSALDDRDNGRKDHDGSDATPHLRCKNGQHRAQNNNASIIDSLLGTGERHTASVTYPMYYRDLLARATRRCIEQNGWRIMRTLGYRSPEPCYTDVATHYDTSEACVADGQLLLAREGINIVVTIDTVHRRNGSIQVESTADNESEVEAFVSSVTTIAHEQNLYKGECIQLSDCISFMDFVTTPWQDLVLNAETKKEIMDNTVGFLARREAWWRLGIPRRRGVMLVGQPGTGKTAICRALMAEAPGITRIITDPYLLNGVGYLSDVYELAEDLRPSIVFLEDIDLVATDRLEYGYREAPTLMSLLSILDGVEAHEDVVTIATTNHIERLDAALAERPSRFDRVIELPTPSLEQREELVYRFADKIPVSDDIKDYIAHQAGECTPAQLQEIIHGLVIENFDEISTDSVNVTRNQADDSIRKVTRRGRRHVGFAPQRDSDTQIKGK